MNEIATTPRADSIFDANDPMSTISRAARDGAEDAREMANKVWAGTGLFLCRLVYTTSYTLSYGVVFPATLIARSIPKENAAVRGLVDGAHAASAKAHAGRSGVEPAPSGI